LPSQDALQSALKEERQAHRKLTAEHQSLLTFLRWVSLSLSDARDA
jgi:hypothetical protein